MLRGPLPCISHSNKFAIVESLSEAAAMSFFENTRKPQGLGGKLMVNMMNIGHRIGQPHSGGDGARTG